MLQRQPPGIYLFTASLVLPLNAILQFPSRYNLDVKLSNLLIPFFNLSCTNPKFQLALFPFLFCRCSQNLQAPDTNFSPYPVCSVAVKSEKSLDKRIRKKITLDSTADDIGLYEFCLSPRTSRKRNTALEQIGKITEIQNNGIFTE